MKTKDINTALLASTALCLSAGSSLAAGSAIIVQDSFDRVGALIGSNADTGQTWTGTSSFITTGTVYQVDGSSSSFATISGLTFDINSCYTLTVEAEIFFPYSDGWMGLGFSSPTSTDAFTNTVGAYIRPDDPEVRTYVTNGLDEQIDTVPDVFPSLMTITVDIGATLSDSTISWFLDSSPIRTGEPVDMTGIDGIFLAHDIVDDMQRASFDRLELLGPIPEPSSSMLISLAATGMLIRRKR